MNNSTVSITRCSDYTARRTAQALEESIGQLPDAARLLAPGKTVLLKPNLLSASQPPQNAVNTHPEVIKAMAEYCIRRKCRVLIGDSCGTLSPGSTQKALEVTRVFEIARETGAEVINFDTAPFREIPVPEGRILDKAFIAGAVLDADVVITLPKLKTHGLTLLTGAVKNQYGTVPGRHKKRIHLLAPKPHLLSEAVVDIFSVSRPHLAVMDAVVAMEGNGPAAGRPRETGMILSSTDSVALDAIAGRMIGYGAGRVMTTTSAARRGLGTDDLKDITIRGVSLEEACIEGFHRPSAAGREFMWRLVPSALSRHVIAQLGGAYPSVEEELCTGCGECIVNCPTGALQACEGRIAVRREDCIGCYCCTEACPRKAIRFRRSGMSRFFPFG